MACPLVLAANEPQAPQQEDHSCCPLPKSGDNCHQPSGKQDCPGMSGGAQVYTYKADSGSAAPVPVVAELPVRAAESAVVSLVALTVKVTPVHSPPDLFLRNSTLLI